ncbi:MAG: LLM class flavin-dependent oxidoreductase [Natronosporangium sp.]
MRFGVLILPEDRWEVAREKWRRVEDWGFDHVWTCDHLNWRSFRDREWFSAIPTLTAAATTTRRITVGVLVASPNIRHPVGLAKDVATLDDISAGRFVLGLGAGAEGFDARMTRRRPWSRRERTERFTEFVGLTDRLLTQPVTTFDGRYYHARDVHSHPPCRQRPRVPFAIAAAGPQGMRLAARHGRYWVTTGSANRVEPVSYDRAVPVIHRQLSQLAEACAATGRDPSTLRRILVAGPTVGGVLASAGAFHDAAGCYAEAGITDLVVHWPRSAEPFQGRLEVLEQVAADLALQRSRPTAPTSSR